MERTILHCDLNNFFAGVECRRNPQLRLVPMAVCGSKESRHGIVLAKNPIAKKFGVKTGEAIWEAKQKCPDLVTVKPNFDDYRYFSHKVREIYADFTDMIEPFGIDECWLDVTGSTRLFGDGESIARQIGNRIKAELDLTISSGVSFNKVFAKLGSGIVPPDSVMCISRDNYRALVWPLPVSELLFVGRSTASKLSSSLGIFTIGDLAAAPESSLKALLGKNGVMLRSYANGDDTSPVQTDRPPVKSIGCSTTPPEDMCTADSARAVLAELAQEIAIRLRQENLKAGSITLSLRNSQLIWTDRQQRLTVPSRLASDIIDAAYALLDTNWDFSEPLHSIGIRTSELQSGTFEQFSLFYNSAKSDKLDKLETAQTKLCESYGNSAVVRATVMNNIKTQKPISFERH